MEPKFIVHTENSDKLAAQMAHFTYLRSFPLNKRVRLLCICTAPFLLVLLLRLLFAPPLTVLDGIIALIGLLPCAMIFFALPRAFRQMYQKSFKECEGAVTTHAFYDDHYTCKQNGEASSVLYDSIKDLEETPDAFRTFCKEKTGKDFIFLK